MAAAERIRDLRSAAGPLDPEDEEYLGLLWLKTCCGATTST